jgi:hypothetical protein
MDQKPERAKERTVQLVVGYKQSSAASQWSRTEPTFIFSLMSGSPCQEKFECAMLDRSRSVTKETDTLTRIE